MPGMTGEKSMERENLSGVKAKMNLQCANMAPFFVAIFNVGKAQVFVMTSDRREASADFCRLERLKFF